MADIDNRGSHININMLRSLTRTANQTLIYKSTLHKIRPVLSKLIKNDIHLTPVASYQQKLPKLPVPELKDSIQKYLKSVIPLLSPEELKTTKCLAEELGQKGGCGEELQKLLKKRAEKEHNWLEAWWLKLAYLGDRMPVVVHCSPGLVFPLQKFCSVEDRLDYTARLIITAMKYKELIDKDGIPMEKQGKDELDMEQYKKFFGTCRIPKPDVDSLEYNPDSLHIVVACNNHFYKLTPVDPYYKYNTLSLPQLVKQLKQILNESCEPGPAIGILSSDNRDCWANNLKLLTKDPQNAKSVCEIQKSLFLVCLDQCELSDCGTNRLTVAGHQTIHGGGSKYNSGNRWFDKTVQFVIGTDGIVGLTYEHSPSEGQPIAVMTDYLINNMHSVYPCGVQEHETKLERLKFNVDEELCEAIQTSSENLDNWLNQFDLQCNVFKDYGKNFIKKQKLSPDSFLQMAMQLSYYRMFCKPTAHYESAATRKYKGGRTETIRSTSVESIKFAEAMLDCNKPPMEKRQLLEAAVNAHKKYTIDAVNGYGVDRHFLGLQLIAAENNIELPKFFKDEAFKRSRYFRLSSSQVATKCPAFMCYGAVVDDGYGICYNPRPDDMYYGIGCFKPASEAKKLDEAFIESLKDMKEVLTKAQKSKL